MVHIDDSTVLVSSSDLRTEMPRLEKEIKVKTVIIMKRGKPMAVLQDFDEHKRKEALIESFEDTAMGRIALKRMKDADERDYISHEAMKKKLEL
ncbi:MAG: hypothetical protein AAB592_00330 [Patescibacteria group bacterium]